MQFIDLKTQYTRIKDDVQKEINEVLDSGQYIMGGKVQELERVLASYVGVKHCVGVADGTTALLVALMALDIKPGDEVIVPSFTFIATASQAALLGAKLVFVDVLKDSFNLDPYKLEQAITKHTKVIIPVSLYGQCPDIDVINQIAAKHGIYVIEDAAQSFGATYKNKKSGSLTTIATTSFFPSKPLGCYGDGGACFTNDDILAKKMTQIRLHGQDRRYHHVMLGINGRLDTLQAGILLAKMRIFADEVIARQRIGKRYNELFSSESWISTPQTSEFNSHVFAQYTIVVDNRDKVLQVLSSCGIPTSIHYPLSLHKQPILAHHYNGQDLTVSDYLSEHVLSLPMHPYLDELTQDIIVDAVKKSL